MRRDERADDDDGYPAEDDRRRLRRPYPGGTRHQQHGSSSALYDPDLPYVVDDKPLSKRLLLKCGVFVVTVVGAVLLVVGIILVVGASGRPDNVAEYNTLASVWERELRPVVANWSGTIANETLAVGRTSLLPVDGGVAATSVFATARLPPPSITRGSVQLDIQNGPNSGVSVDNIEFIREQASSPSECIRSACGRNEGEPTTSAACRTNEDPFDCTTASLTEQCQRLHGSNATYDGIDLCVEFAVCGKCVYTAFLADLCVVVERDTSSADPTAWRVISKFQSCVYPFTARNYTGFQPEQLPVSVFHVLDPTITAERVTQGSGQFPPSEPATSPGGIAALVFGVLIILAGVAGCVYVILTRQDEEEEELDEFRDSVKHLPLRQRLEAIRAERLRRARRPRTAVEPPRVGLYRLEATRLDAIAEARAERANAASSSRRQPF